MLLYLHIHYVNLLSENYFSRSGSIPMLTYKIEKTFNEKSCGKYSSWEMRETRHNEGELNIILI